MKINMNLYMDFYGRRVVRLLAILLLSFCCSRSASAEANWVEELPSDWLRSLPAENQIPSFSDYPTAGAVYLLDEDIFYVADKIEVTVVVMKIFNRRGYRHAEVTTPFYRGDESVEVRGRTKKKDGTVIELRPEDIHEIWVSDDLKKKKFTLPGVEDDCLIHYEIVYRSKKFTLSGIRYFQSDEPTVLSRFNLVVPNHLQVLSYDSPPGVLDTAKEVPFHSESASLYTFAKRNLLPREIEPYMPSSFESFPCVAFSVAAKVEEAELQASWSNTSRWYWETVEQHFVPTKEMKKLAKNLTKDIIGDREKTERLFYHVQSNFRIGFTSRSIFDMPQTIFDRQVGSSAEVAGILYALFTSAKIPVALVLVPDRHTVRNLPPVPMLDWFSHVLLKVEADGEDLWLDPHYAANGINCISEPYRDVDGLLIRPEGGELLRTPAGNRSENVKVTAVILNLGSDGNFECEVTESYSPCRSGRVRSLLRKRTIQERRDDSAKRICEECPGAILDSCVFGDIYSYGDDFVIYYRFHSSHYAQKADTLLYLNPKIIDRDATTADFSEPSRIFPIMFKQLLTDVDTVIINLPPAYQVVHLPELVHLDNDFAEFYAEYQSQTGSVTYQRTFILKEQMVPASSYEEVKDFFNQVFLQDQRFITLKKVK